MRTQRGRVSIFLIAALVIGSTLSVAAPAVPQARAATTLEVCGTVTGFVRPTAVLQGAITIGDTAWVIAAGTEVSSDLDAGADLCLRLTLNANGTITDLAVVRADATSTLRLCGEVTAFSRAESTSTGRLTIGGRTFDIATNVHLPASVRVGADICAKFELNGFGQIRDGDVTANATSTVRLCGIVEAFAEATATKTGDLSLANRDFVVAVGADLPGAITAGADLCATLQINGFGQVQDGDVTANATSRVEICGVVEAFADATASKTGTLSIASRDFVVAMGADLPGAINAGANLCATLQLNGFGQVQDGTVSANLGSTLTVCGQVSAFTQPSATQNGSLTIGGTSRSIAAGADIDSRVQAGAFLRLRLTLDAVGRITDATTLRVGVSVSDACSVGAIPPSPAPTSEPAPTPAPTPEFPVGPTPPPSGAPGAATPAPSPAFPGGPTPNPQGDPGSGEVCSPADGDGPAAAGGSQGDAPADAAPDLPDTASAVERAGLVIASAAIPFLLFLVGMFVITAAAWWRRQEARP